MTTEAPALPARCPRCGGAVVKAHGEASCLACGYEVVAIVRAWETAPSMVPIEPMDGRIRRKGADFHLVPWTDEERRAWREWKPGDPVPGVGYEEKEEPMDQGDMADKIRASNMDRPGPARFDIQTLRTQAQTRCDELVGLIQRERERSAERIAVANEELGQLRKALVALGVKPEPKPAVSKSAGGAGEWCQECERGFPSRQALGTHKARIHTAGRAKCQGCGQEFSAGLGLATHQRACAAKVVGNG